MNLNKIIMGLGITILLAAGTYSVSNLYYFGPKKYHKKIESCEKALNAGEITAAEMREQVEECGNSIYPKSLGGGWVAAGGMALYVFGLIRAKNHE